jgi:hypothetical protein
MYVSMYLCIYVPMYLCIYVSMRVVSQLCWLYMVDGYGAIVDQYLAISVFVLVNTRRGFIHQESVIQSSQNSRLDWFRIDK